MTRYKFLAVDGKVELLLTGTERDEGNARFIIGDADAGTMFGAEAMRVSRGAEEQVARLVGGER